MFFIQDISHPSSIFFSCLNPGSACFQIWKKLAISKISEIKNLIVLTKSSWTSPGYVYQRYDCFKRQQWWMSSGTPTCWFQNRWHTLEKRELRHIQMDGTRIVRSGPTGLLRMMFLILVLDVLCLDLVFCPMDRQSLWMSKDDLQTSPGHHPHLFSSVKSSLPDVG